MSVDEQQSQAKIDSLVASGEDAGCVNLSELDELLTALELDDEDVSTLYERLDAHGVERERRLRAQRRRAHALVNGELAGRTTDALQLFLNEIRKYPLLTATEEVELAKRVEAATSTPRSA